MRDVLKRLMGWGRDDAFDDLRRSLASHRASAAQREVAVINRVRQLETGHYLGDRVGRRIGPTTSARSIDDQPLVKLGDADDG